MQRVLALVLALAVWPAAAGLIEGRVIEVTDGDSLTVLSKSGASIHRVRLAGIVVPPRSHPFGDRSRENLRRLLIGRSVRLVSSTLDARGQLVGVVWVTQKEAECRVKPCPDKLDAGQVQLTKGLAWVDEEQMPRHSAEVQKTYAEAELHAREHRIGLWRDPGPPIRADLRSGDIRPLRIDDPARRP